LNPGPPGRILNPGLRPDDLGIHRNRLPAWQGRPQSIWREPNQVMSESG